ncbi:MAG: sigma-70 family RNA polymerase sigma factor [Planctomycetaceae bacterium]
MPVIPSFNDSDWQASIRGLKSGEPAVLQQFYARFGPMLRAIAEKRVAPPLRPRFDADDVVQSTFRTFFRRAQGGQFLFEDNERLWSLLCAITLTKLREKARFHQRQSRTVRRERPVGEGDGEGTPEAAWAVKGAPPEAALEFAEEFERVLSELNDDERRLVDLKLQDRTNDEAAEALGVSERTVRRLLAGLHEKFQSSLSDRA